MKELLDGWNYADNDVYDFFKQENIDVSGCSEFDFKERTKKPRQVKIAKKSQVQKDNLNAKTTTAEGQKDISNEVDSANKIKEIVIMTMVDLFVIAHTHPMISN